jgi:transposase-like protein
MNERKFHSEKFKRDAVKLLDAQPHDSPAKVAKEIGVSKSALYRWKALYSSQAEPDEHEHKPERALTRLVAERDQLQAECRALRQTLLVLDTENH